MTTQNFAKFLSGLIFSLAFSLISGLGLTALLLMFGAEALAAPMPGSTSSSVVKPQLGLYRSPTGFQLHAAASGWELGEPPKDAKYVQALYRKAGSGEDGASLTVRVDKLDKETTLSKYVQRWSKEYPRFGFDLLGSKAFSQNKQKGYVLDLINRDSGKQMRQVVYLKKQNAVILTCRDKIKTFRDTLKACNQITKTFVW